MPKDDYLKAKRRDIARRATARQGYLNREKQRQRAKHLRAKAAAKAQRRLLFPVHEYIYLPDGTFRSKEYVLPMSRWD